MRNQFSFLVVVVVLMAGILTVVTPASGQNPQRVVSVNPVGLIFGIADVEYQQNIDKSSAWAVEALYWGHKIVDWSWSAVGAGGSYRKWFFSFKGENPTAPEGGYWSVGVDALFLSATYASERASSFSFGPRGGVGYRWLLGSKKNFSISVGIEVMYYFGSIEILGVKMPYTGIGYSTPLSIGYAW